MDWRKDPLFKRYLLALIIAAAAIAALLLGSDILYIRRLASPGSGFYHWLPLRDAGLMLLITAVNLVLFTRMINHIAAALERTSSAADRIMAGDFSSLFGHSGNSEGIISRLESQFGQMSRRLQLSLESMHREKEKVKALTSDISHQIKTPLASLQVLNSLLLEEELSPQERQEFLHHSQKEIEKLEWLSTSLLKMSHLESGMIQLKKEKGDLRQTIVAAVNGIYPQALEKDIEIDMSGLMSLRICHDIRWTREALFNVMENAVKYTPTQGHIKIGMEKLEQYVKVDIEDSGIGIPPQEMEHIFERFYRGRSQAIQNAPGLGIGLYLSRNILEEQGGGIIAVPTEKPGSKFSLLLSLQNCKE
jgi:signal transduction histidine kinase